MEFRAAGARRQSFLWIFVVIVMVAISLPVFFIGRSLLGSLSLSYRLTPDHLVVEYGPGGLTLGRSEIDSAEVYPRLTKGMRTGGTAMRGLYDGRWRFAETGPITLFAASTEPVVVVRAKDGQVWGITPQNPEEFVAALREGKTGGWEPKRNGSPWWALTVLLPLLPLAGIFVPILLYYMRLPERIRYTLAEDALLVTGGRVRLAMPYGEIESIDVGPFKGTPWRKWGAGLPGLLWGKFYWKQAGGSLELYATGYRPIVLITAAGRRVGITPEDQDRFVAELARRMAG